MNQEENEISINLLDLLAYLIHHWKTFAVLFFVSTILVGSIMSFRDYRNLKLEHEEENIIEVPDKLSDAQKNDVQQFYNKYLSYKERIEDSRFYLDNSLKMKLNSNKVSVYTVEYLIKSNYQGIISSLSSSAIDLDDYEKMAGLIGEDIDPRYVNELLNLSGSVQQESYDVGEDEEDEDLGDTEEKVKYKFTSIFTVSVTTNSKETCEKIAGVLDGSIKEHLEKLSSVGIDSDISELTASYTERIDSELAEYQRTMTDGESDLITEYYSYVGSAKTTLDEHELQAFKAMLNEEELESFEEIIDKIKIESTEGEKVKPAEANDHIRWKKWIGLGAALGLIIAGIILSLNYIFMSEIKTPDDAYGITKEKEMGIVIQKPKSRVFLGKLFHDWANRIELHGIKRLPDDESILLISDRIVKLCQIEKSKRLILLSDSVTGYTKESLDKCAKIISDAGLDATISNPSASVEDLKALQSLEGAVAVLALTNKKSLPDSVKRNIAVCRENSIPIIGNFIIFLQ